MTGTEIEKLAEQDVCLSVSRDPAELACHAEAWDQLIMDCVQRSPMLSYAWVSSYLDHRLREGESWYVVLAHVGDRLIGVLPVVVTPNRVAGFSRPVLRTPNDNHTLGGDILMIRDAPANLLNKILEAAERETPNRFVLELHRVVENSPSLASSCANIGRNVYQELTCVGYYFPVDGEFDEYFSSLSKKFRDNLRRAENQIKQASDIKTIIKEGGAAKEHELARFMQIEASGWKGREGSAIQTSSELQEFYVTLIRRLSKSGMLRWEFLESDGLTLAANLSIRFGSIVVIWKLGYEEDYSRYSPGGVLFKHVLERAFSDDSINEFNLLTDTTWQTKWNPKQRSYFNFYRYPRHPLSYLFGYAPRRAKDLVRRIPVLLNLMKKVQKWGYKLT